MHVFQRTAPWIMPHTDRPISPRERRLYRRFPLLQRLVRGGIYSGRELLVLGFVKRPRLMKLVEKLARKHMDSQISDPELRRKVEPGYTIGCKRILPSNKWYPALGRENVELVTDGVSEVREHSIVTGGGEEVEVDAIIFGTGFNVTDMPVARYVRGRAGRTLDEHWEGSPQAHLGSTVPGFPNLFMLLGPNTGLGHSSMVYMIESQVAYVIEALQEMRRRGAGTAEVKADAVRDFNDALDRAHGGHGLEHRLLELVPRRHRPQRDPLAGLDVRVPPPRRPLRRVRVRARRGRGRDPRAACRPRRRSCGSSGPARRARGPRGGCRARRARPPRSRCP